MISMIIIYSVEYHHPTIESLCVDNKEVKLKPAIIVERIKCLELAYFKAR